MYLKELRNANANLCMKDRTICYLADKLALAEERLQQYEKEVMYK